MPFKRSSLRYAHTAGFSHCCYTEDGETIITTGSDGDVRIWKGVDDDDPNTRCVGEFILYHAYYDKRILASTDLNTVQAYTYPDGDRDGIEFRFTAPVTCIKVNDKYIAACSEDMTIKVVPKDKSSEPFELSDHDGPVLRIDLSVNGLLASSSGDGTMKIWNLNERKVIKTFTGFSKIKSYNITNQYVTPSFEPKQGKYMAYNDRNKILIVDTTNWAVKKTLQEGEDDIEYSVCSYSPCGRYLAAGGIDGETPIWDIDGNRLIKGARKDPDSQCITAVQWNPIEGKGELAYMDNSGQFGVITDIFDNANDPLERDGDLQEDANGDVDFGDLVFEDDNADGDNENCVSLEKLKNETMRKNIDDEIDEFLEDVSVKSTIADDRREASVERFRSYPLQPPFQPGATSKSLEHRYMVWNQVGIVRAHKTDSENSIEVEFHDSSVHHSIHITNYANHTLASLSTTVLALCCESPSKLVCIALCGSGGNREWSMEMPNCEEILCVAASEKLVAVATDARYLRLFSAMGNQREVLSLPGPVVALSAHADRILVAYHSNAATEDQHISLKLLQTIGLSLRCRDVKVALTPGSRLTWVGYTHDKGTPATCDSMGMVRMYSMSANHWMPVCDTSLHTKGDSDNYFITDVSEGSQIVRGILCRGSAHPLTKPKPLLSELPMQIPMCDLESERSQLEDILVRYGNFHADDAERVFKENAIKLFAKACRTEMEARAKELIEMIAMPQLLPLAIKYAGNLGRLHLAEKLGELQPHLNEQEKLKEQFEESEQATNLLLNSPATENLIKAQREKYSSPSIIPRPLSVSQLKRNPFKKAQSMAKQANNPLKHLTDNVAGFDSQDNFVENEVESAITTASATDSSPTDTDLENSNPNGNTIPKPTFMMWFKEHRAEIQAEKTDLTPAELTKFAMSKYKQLYTVGEEKSNENVIDDTAKQTNGTAKRKLNDGQSGIAKLAKFNFSK